MTQTWANMDKHEMSKRDFVMEYMQESNKKINFNQKKVDRDIIHAFTEYLVEIEYTKRHTWLGRPIIQYPTDLIVLQELIWELKPDIIIETGTAFGGTAMFYASILQSMKTNNIKTHLRKVITIDIDIRNHNWNAIRNSPLGDDIIMIKGDSVSEHVLAQCNVEIREWGGEREPKVMVCLDSNHTYDHVLKELKLYADLVTPESYMIVFDTAIELMMKKQPADRPWGPGNNPYTAVQKFLLFDHSFVVDKEIERRAMITAAPGGWLRKIYNR